MSPVFGVFSISLTLFTFCGKWMVTEGQVDAGTITSEINKRAELQRFAAWLTRTQMAHLFDGPKYFTIFVPNNTAFEMMPRRRMAQLIQSDNTIKNYIKAYTISDDTIQTSGMTDNTMVLSLLRTKIYYARPQEQAGVYEYYVNGAHIVNKDIRCSNGILHVVGQLTDMPSTQSVWAYMANPKLPFLNISRFYNFLEKYSSNPYYKALHDISNSQKLTMFVPTNEALERIPSHYLSRLENKIELDTVLHKCYIKNMALMTSWIRHKDTYKSASPTLEEKISFRKLTRDGIDKVFVHSGGVSAEVVYGNITVSNGVIHIVDRMLGYTYHTARNEIVAHKNFATSIFKNYLENAPTDIRSAVNGQDASQITVFVPTDEAFNEVKNFAPWFNLDSLSNQQIILELHMLQLGLVVNVLLENVEFENRATFRSRYRNEYLSVYARYDLSFVEGGYVRSRVVGPDVGVTNGVVQYIDRVLGVPVRDIPGVMCEDNWLRAPYQAIRESGLISLLTDCRLVTKRQTCKSIYSLDLNKDQSAYRYVYKPSDVKPCSPDSSFSDRYTFFVPNGTDIESFRRDRMNRVIWENPASYLKVLKRHVIEKVIYLDRLGVGNHQYKNILGEVITIRKNFYRIASYEINFHGRSATVLQADLGATNGVLHIINAVLFMDEDKGTGSGHRLTTGITLIVFCLVFIRSAFS